MTSRSHDPAVAGLEPTSILLCFFHNAGPHLSQLEVVGDDEEATDKGVEVGAAFVTCNRSRVAVPHTHSEQSIPIVTPIMLLILNKASTNRSRAA
jgi:hypothetical protein